MAALNNAAVPNVNCLNAEDLFRLVGHADFARVAVKGDDIVGLIVVFAPGAAYESVNYQWFDKQYQSFLYIDRIVVSDAMRGRGIGETLYSALFSYAEAHADRVACEVNERPPNPGSMRFHERLGFSTVGRQETEGGAKSVALMIKEIGK